MAKRSKKRKSAKTKEPSWKKGLRAARRARNAAKRAHRKHPVKAHTRRIKTRGPRCIKRKGARSYKNPKRSRRKRVKAVRVRAHRSYEAKEACKPRRRKRRAGARKAARRGSSRRRSSKRAGMTKHQVRVAAGQKAARTRKRNARSYGGSVKVRRAKRMSGGRTYHRLGPAPKRKNPKRVAAAKKAARTRAYNKANRAYGGSITPTSHRLAAGERGRRRRSRRGYARENPLSGAELFIGSVTALFGFAAEDLLDRMLATHPLTVTTNKDAAGHILYTDTPPAAGSAYAGLYNGTAVLAPYNWKRWLFGGMVTLVPLGLAHWPVTSTSPKTRASLQMFAFGAGIRWLGKGLTDIVAKALSYTCTGQRLYDPEIRASALVPVSGNTGDASLTGFPTAGLGAPRLPAQTAVHQLGVGSPKRCAKCGKPGLGQCCGTLAGCCPPPGPNGQVPGTLVPPTVAAGPGPTNNTPMPQQIQGVPQGFAGSNGAFAPRRDGSSWGYDYSQSQ